MPLPKFDEFLLPTSHTPSPDDRDYLRDGEIYRQLLQGVIRCNSGTGGDPLTGPPPW